MQKKENRTLVLRREVWYTIISRKDRLCHEKIRNQRKDFLHKLSYEMAEAYDVVAVEDIDMK
ncbi:transposase, partial [Coprococcus catus]